MNSTLVYFCKRITSFETDIFKNAFTDLGLYYLSYEPMKYKINSIKALIYRAFNLSNYTYFNNEVPFLNIFLKRMLIHQIYIF